MTMSRKPSRDPRVPWRPPTRRAFVAALGAAAATLAVERRGLLGALGDDDAERRRRAWAGPTRWIGHC